MSRGVLVMLAACGRLGFGGRAEAPDGATDSAHAGDAYAPCATPGFVAAGRSRSRSARQGGLVDAVVGNQIDNTIGIYLNDGSAVLGSANPDISRPAISMATIDSISWSRCKAPPDVGPARDVPAIAPTLVSWT